MIFRGPFVWVLLGAGVLCLCVAQVSHAVLAFDVSNTFPLDTRESPAFALSNVFVLDTQEPGSNVGYSAVFVLDTVLDIGEAGSNEGYSNLFTLDVRGAVVLYGDVSNNREVTAYDAALILQHTVGLMVLVGRDSVAADVSGVSGISPYDASLVLQYVVEKIDRFPVEAGGQARLAAFSRTVGISRIGSTSEGHFVVPVSMDGMEGVWSGELVVGFDPSRAEAMSVVPSALLSSYRTEHHITDGKVRVSFAGAEPGAGGGEVLEVIFRPVEPSVDALRGMGLEHVRLNEGQVAVQLANNGKPEVPTTYVLYPNFPNPFNPATTIPYGLPVPGRVVVVVYNLSGQKVRELVSGLKDAGMHAVRWDGKDDGGREVGSGVYICLLESGRHREVRQMMVVK